MLLGGRVKPGHDDRESGMWSVQGLDHACRNKNLFVRAQRTLSWPGKDI